MKGIVKRCENVLERLGLKKVYMNLFYNKKDKNRKIVKDRSPVLCVKVPYFGKDTTTPFRRKDKIVDPFDYFDKRCWAKLALKIESIFISTKVMSLQIKVYEALVKPLGPRKSLLVDAEEEEEEDDIFTSQRRIAGLCEDFPN